LTKLAFQGELECPDPEKTGQHAIVCNGRSATLHVAKYRFPDLGITADRFELIRQLVGDATEPLMLRSFFSGTDLRRPDGMCTFGDYYVHEALSLNIAPFDLLEYLSNVIRDFRDQADLSAARDGGMQGNPAGVTPHDFHDHHPVVALGSGNQFIEAVRRDLHCGLEPKGHISCGQVIIYRFGYANHRYALLEEGLRNALRPISSYIDDRIKLQRFEFLDKHVRPIFKDNGAVRLFDRKVKWVPFVCCFENCPTLNVDAGDLFSCTLDDLLWLRKNAIKSFDASV